MKKLLRFLFAILYLGTILIPFIGIWIMLLDYTFTDALTLKETDAYRIFFGWVKESLLFQELTY